MLTSRTKHVLHCVLLFHVIVFFEVFTGGVRLFGYGQEEIDPWLCYGYFGTIVLYTLRLLTFLTLPQVLFNFFGLTFYNAFPDKVTLKGSPLLAPFICVRVVTRGDYPQLVKNNVLKNIDTCVRAGLENFIVDVVTDKQINLENLSRRVREIVVPANYKPKSGALFKARALQYCLEDGVNYLADSDWIVHLDEETLLTENSVRGILNFVLDGKHHFGQGLITYANEDVVNWVTTLADSFRVADDMGKLRLQFSMFHKPLFSWKGSYVVTQAKENAVVPPPPPPPQPPPPDTSPPPPPPKQGFFKKCNNFWCCQPDDPNEPRRTPKEQILTCLKPERVVLDEDGLPKRQAWKSRFAAFISILGMSVGLGQVWRFPALAYKYGGGAFVIIYGVMILVLGNILFFFELCQGQYSGKNLAHVYEKVPLFMGVGWSMISYALFFSIYYNNVVSFALYYFISSFKHPSPWTYCPAKEDFYDPVKCAEDLILKNLDCGGKVISFNRTQACLDKSYSSKKETECCPQTPPCSLYNITDICRVRSTPSEYFWAHTVVRVYREGDPSYGYLGAPNLRLVFCLLFAWFLNWLTLYKGVNSLSYLMFFMAPLPYIVFFTMLFMSLFKDGGVEGVIDLFTPDLSSFLSLNIWRIATEQAFYSLGVSMGALITFGSYNPFSSPIHRDVVWICLIVIFTSILTSSVVFATLGLLAANSELIMDDTLTTGPGLVFVAYPESLELLPGSYFFCVLFYFMIVILGSSSVSATVESVSSAVYDIWPNTRSHKHYVNAVILFSCFAIGLPITCRGGLTVYDTFDYFPAGMTLIPICTLELIAIIYVYGLTRFCEDIEYMIGWYPNRLYRYGWLVGPFILSSVFIAGLVHISLPNFKLWSVIMGWFLFFCVISPTFVGAFYYIHYSQTNGECKDCVKPLPEFGPKDKYDRKFRDMYVTNREFW